MSNMKTNELINLLAQSEPVSKKPKSSVLVVMGLGILWCVLTLAIFGGRTDWNDLNTAFYIKTILLLGSAFCGAFYAFKASKTIGSESRYIGFWIVMSALAIWTGYEWVSVDSALIMSMLMTKAAGQCMISTLLYGLFSMAILTLVFKQYAPANVKQSAHNIGLTSGLLAGFGYSIHCMMDSPTYIIFAYGLPVLLIWGISLLILPRFLNW